jgi:dihydrolipoamide dehydrogenase
VIGKAQILGAAEGMVKIVSDGRYDELLGAHIVGPHATELIIEACAALQMEATVEEVIRMMHAHPTVSETFKEAAEDVHHMAIHI